MLKSYEIPFGIELNSSTFGHHIVWMIEDKRNNKVYSMGKRTIKPFGKPDAEKRSVDIMEQVWNELKCEKQFVVEATTLTEEQI